MKLFQGRIWKEKVDDVSDNSESELKAETDSTDCTSDSIDVSDETSSRRSSSTSCDESWETGDFCSNKLSFMSTDSGCASVLAQKLQDSTPVDFFNLFFDQNLMQLIVDQTNLYHNQMQETTSKKHPWFDVTIDEMYVFLATTMLMSFMEKDKLLHYLSPDGLMTTPIFNESFSRHRYFAILRNLHFNDNNSTEQSEDSRLQKVNPVLCNLQEKFSDSFYPYQNICVDESMISSKGHLKFQQCISSKRSRLGIRLFLMRDCSTGFILNFVVHNENTAELVRTKELDISGSIVMTLMKNYLDKGHILYVDDWCSSPKLFQILYERSTGTCGTVRKNRSGFPLLQENLQQGEQSSLHRDSMLALKWHDKKDVYMLSTVHDSSMISTGRKNSATGEELLKPLCVKDYDQNRNAVDRSDMQMKFSKSLQESLKWYNKLFFHMMNLSILNAHILFKKVQQRHLPLSRFRYEVIRGLLAKYGYTKTHIRRVFNDHSLRLTTKHSPALIPPNDSNQTPRRRCYVCTNYKRQPKEQSYTRYQCLECNIGLCVPKCFQQFHASQRA